VISSRQLRWIPLVLFTLALIIRLIGLNWGLPTSERFYSYHPDERQMLGAIANIDILRGEFNPHFFSYPSLFIYMAALTHFVASGFLPSLGNSVWALSHDVLLHARWVSALLGALTVPVVFALGREIGGAKLGLLAALLLCFPRTFSIRTSQRSMSRPLSGWRCLCGWPRAPSIAIISRNR